MSKTNIAVLVGVVCLLLSIICTQELFAGDNEESAPEEQCHWVHEASNLIEKLSNLASNSPVVDSHRSSTDLSSKGRFNACRKAAKAYALSDIRAMERILWKLWLVTGKPPLTQKQDETVYAFLQQNVVAYRCYVNKHAKLSQEAICRLGLCHTVDSIGSPLWYMTVKYITTMASFPRDRFIDIRTIPRHTIIEIPLSDENYNHLSIALSHWLEVNQERMDWNPKAKRFRPQGGKYTALDELWDVIARCTNPISDEGHKTPCTKKMPNEKIDK